MRRGFKVTRKIRWEIQAIADAVGCKLDWNRKCGVQWNGSNVACKDQDASNILHDIAHYTVASPRERKCLDFGLGAGPDTENFDYGLAIHRLYSRNKCNKIEERASALGIYWEKQIGLPWESTAVYHSWWGTGQEPSEELKKMWTQLSRYIKKTHRLTAES